MEELMSPLGKSQSLYRGVYSRKQVKKYMAMVEGDVLPSNAFVSTTRSPAISEDFTESGAIIMEIKCSSDTRAITLDTSEMETILDVGQKFRVSKVYEDVQFNKWLKLGRYIVLEAVDNSVESTSDMSLSMG